MQVKTKGNQVGKAACYRNLWPCLQNLPFLVLLSERDLKDSLADPLCLELLSGSVPV